MKNIGFTMLSLIAVIFAILAIKATQPIVSLLDVCVAVCFLILAWDDYKRSKQP